MSVIQSISDVAKFSGRCLASVPTEAWLITALAVPTFFYLRRTPPPKFEYEMEIESESKETVWGTMETETVTMEFHPKNTLLKIPTNRFNELLRKDDLSVAEGREFSDLWRAPEFVAVVDARSLPSDWVGKLQTQFGEKVITD